MGRLVDCSEPIDGKTSRSICDAVGERLRQSLRPDLSNLPDYLHRLMMNLRDRDDEDRPEPPN